MSNVIKPPKGYWIDTIIDYEDFTEYRFINHLRDIKVFIVPNRRG